MTDLTVELPGGGEVTLEELQRFGEEVISRVRSASPSDARLDRA